MLKYHISNPNDKYFLDKLKYMSFNRFAKIERVFFINPDFIHDNISVPLETNLSEQFNPMILSA